MTAAAALLLSATADAAQGATGARGVSVVSYTQGALLIQLSDNINYHAKTSDSCTLAVKNIDTLKTWASLAQAALLSGKEVQIYWNRCSDGKFYIETLELRK